MESSILKILIGKNGHELSYLTTNKNTKTFADYFDPLDKIIGTQAAENESASQRVSESASQRVSESASQKLATKEFLRKC